MKIKFLLIGIIIFSSFINGNNVKAETPVKVFCQCKTEDKCLNFPAYDAEKPAPANIDVDCKACDGVKGNGSCPTVKPVAKKGEKVGVISLTNPLQNDETDVRKIIGNIIKGLMAIMGGLCLVMVVKGGTTWVLSMGNPEKITSGGQTMLWAILGMVLTIASYLILTNVFKAFFAPIN